MNLLSVVGDSGLAAVPMFKANHQLP